MKDLCLRNGELNGVPLTAIRHEWGGSNVDAIAAACSAHERSSGERVEGAEGSHPGNLMSGVGDASGNGHDLESNKGLEAGNHHRAPCRLILMSDVYYYGETLPGGGTALERSLRGLIAHGGCRMVVASWKVRTMREEGFLWRLRDLGRVMPTVRCGNGVCVGALELS